MVATKLAVVLLGVLISPYDGSKVESYTGYSISHDVGHGISIEDIAPAWAGLIDFDTELADGDTAEGRVSRWLKKQRYNVQFYSAPGNGAFKGSVFLCPLPARRRGKPPCVPELSTIFLLSFGGLGIYVTRRARGQ